MAGTVNLETNALHFPLADITALKAIDTTSYANGVCAEVLSTGILRFLKTSTTTPNEVTVFSPDVGGGRWILSTLINNAGIPQLPTGINLDANSNKIINLANGVDDGDAVNFSQIKNLTQYWQRVATTLSPLTAGDNISTTGTLTAKYLSLDFATAASSDVAKLYDSTLGDTNTLTMSLGKDDTHAAYLKYTITAAFPNKISLGLRGATTDSLTLESYNGYQEIALYSDSVYSMLPYAGGSNEAITYDIFTGVYTGTGTVTRTNAGWSWGLYQNSTPGASDRWFVGRTGISVGSAGLLSSADLVVNRAGNVGVGVSNPAYKFDVDGIINSNSQIQAQNLVLTSNDTVNTVYINNTGGGGGTQPALRIRIDATSGARNLTQLEDGSGIFYTINDGRIFTSTGIITHTGAVGVTGTVTASKTISPKLIAGTGIPLIQYEQNVPFVWEQDTAIANVTGFTQPRGMCYCWPHESMFVCDTAGNAVREVDCATATVTDSITTGMNSPWACVFDGVRYVWVANLGAGNILKIDIVTNTVVATVANSAAYLCYAVDYYGVGFIFAANSSGNVVYKINATTNTVVQTISVGTTPVDMVWAPDPSQNRGGVIWTCNYASHNSSAIRIGDGAIDATLALSAAPTGVCFDGAWLWFALNDIATVKTYNPFSGQSYTYDTGANPCSIRCNGREVFLGYSTSGGAIMSKWDVKSRAQWSTFGNVGFTVENVCLGMSPNYLWVSDRATNAVKKINAQYCNVY